MRDTFLRLRPQKVPCTSSLRVFKEGFWGDLPFAPLDTSLYRLLRRLSYSIDYCVSTRYPFTQISWSILFLPFFFKFYSSPLSLVRTPRKCQVDRFWHILQLVGTTSLPMAICSILEGERDCVCIRIKNIACFYLFKFKK